MFVVFCFGLVFANFTHILQGCITGTWAIIWLPQCQWCNPEGHGLFDDINTLRPRENGCLFPDDIYKCIFLNENVWIVLKISLKFVPKERINSTPALVQIMAWRQPGDKPLFEPMIVSLLMHICVTRPQWVNPPGTCNITTTVWYYVHFCGIYCARTVPNVLIKTSCLMSLCQ